jgi:hypothetical protein
MSPKFASKESMRGWHADHKRDECVARRSSATAVGRAGLLDELAAKTAHARSFEKIPEPTEQSAAPLWGSSTASTLRHTATVIDQLRAAAEALGHGDPESFASLFAEDAEWRGPSRGHLWWKHTPS